MKKRKVASKPRPLKPLTKKQREKIWAEARRMAVELQPMVDRLLATQGLTTEDAKIIVY
jgi:uncharacterized protein YjiS (DUF1127 family)